MLKLMFWEKEGLFKYLKCTPNVLMILVTLILLIPFSSSTSQWETFQKFNSRTGFQDPSYSVEFLDVDIYSKILTGSQFQPLVYDLDQDNNSEIIGHSTNFVRLYHSSGVINLYDEINIGGTQEAQGVVLTERNRYIVPANEKIYSINYNGTDFNTKNFTPNVVTKTGVACDSTSCYVGNSSGHVIKFTPSTNTTTDNLLIAGAMFGDVAHGIYISPVIFDLNNDDIDDVIFLCDPDSDGKDGICTIKTTDLTFNTDFNTVGYLDDIDGTAAMNVHATGLLVANLDGGGTPEVCVTWYREGSPETSEDGLLQCWNSDGSKYFLSDIIVAADVQTGGQAIAFAPVMADIDNVGQFEICSVGCVSDGGFGEHLTSLNCYNTFDATLESSTGLFNDHQEFIFWNDIGDPFGVIQFITSADLNNDGYHDILFPNTIFYSDGVDNFTQLNLTTNPFNVSIRNVPADINNDNILDIVGQMSGFISSVFSNTSNVPPVLNGRNFGQNYLSPVCLDTSVTFTAAECSSATSICHYDQDFQIDDERLISTCGNGTVLFNGSWYGASSQISCFYSQLGSFAVDLYLQDNYNKGDFSQKQTVSLIVINGTAGLTCNIPVSLEIIQGLNETTSVASDDQITTEEDLKEVLEIFTAQSQYMKTLLVLIFSVGMLGLLVKLGMKDPFSIGISIFMLWMIFAMLGLLQWVYIFIFAMVAIGLGSAYVVVGSRNTG